MNKSKIIINLVIIVIGIGVFSLIVKYATGQQEDVRAKGAVTSAALTLIENNEGEKLQQALTRDSAVLIPWISQLLKRAILTDKLEMAEILIKNGADVNEKVQGTGKISSSWPIICEYVNSISFENYKRISTIQFLLDKGASKTSVIDCNEEDRSRYELCGMNALKIAEMKGLSQDIIQLLR
jgi:hypothetical protein